MQVEIRFLVISSFFVPINEFKILVELTTLRWAEQACSLPETPAIASVCTESSEDCGDGRGAGFGRWHGGHDPGSPPKAADSSSGSFPR